MSRRTAEASKGVRQAWLREQQLVLDGKGTRDWTPEEQRDICERGRAYDVDGRAYEGHHMQNVEGHPEYQGDSDNIQFLTRNEHFAAHNYDWKNPTNGYYDFVSGKTIDFGSQKYVSCEIKELSEPVCLRIEEECPTAGCSDEGSVPKEEETLSKSTTPEEEGDAVANHDGNGVEVSPKHGPRPGADSTGPSDIPLWARVVKGVTNFNARHPILAGVTKAVGAAAATLGAEVLISAVTGGSGTNGDNAAASSSSARTIAYALDDNDILTSTRSYPSERSSPREHHVSGYDRIQNNKTVHVNPYTRGKG